MMGTYMEDKQRLLARRTVEVQNLIEILRNSEIDDASRHPLTDQEVINLAQDLFYAYEHKMDLEAEIGDYE